MTRRLPLCLTALLACLALTTAWAAAATHDGVSRSATGAVTAAAGASPRADAHPSLVLTASDLSAIRARIVAGTRPWASSFHSLTYWGSDRSPRLPTAGETRAMRGRPSLDDVQRPYFDHINRDGAYTRNEALLWWSSGKRSRYLDEVHRFVLAWARGYTPIDYTFTPDDNGDPGYLQAFGIFSFAYAYDLTYSTYTSDQHAVIDAWFAKCAVAQQSNMTRQIASVKVKYAPDANGDPTRDPWEGYHWRLADGTRLRYAAYEHDVGGNFVTFPMLSGAAAAWVSGYRPFLDWAFDPANPVAYQREVAALLHPRNEGDGVASHGSPVPAQYIDKRYIAGRGGALDYSTYATRLADVMCGMGPAFRAAGYDKAPTVADNAAALADSWRYLGRFFGPDRQRDPVPGDRTDFRTALPRFVVALHDTGDRDRYLPIIRWYKTVTGSRTIAAMYEPQLLGQVVLTHWPH